MSLGRFGERVYPVHPDLEFAFEQAVNSSSDRQTNSSRVRT